MTNDRETYRMFGELQTDDLYAGQKRVGYRTAKRVFDVCFSVAATAILCIPIFGIAIIVFIESPGNPFYTQLRVGKGGKPIKIFKIRSMVADADNVGKYLSPKQMRQWKAERKVDDDPRITRIGHFLRKSSLDEVPQFINVLLGDMSVVGPRPISSDELEQWFTDDEKIKLLSVPQGVTGRWQTEKRNGATFESGERQRLELEYVDMASVWTDLRIILSTFTAMFDGTGR